MHKGSMTTLRRLLGVVLMATMAITVTALLSQCKDDERGAKVTVSIENVK